MLITACSLRQVHMFDLPEDGQKKYRDLDSDCRYASESPRNLSTEIVAETSLLYNGK